MSLAPILDVSGLQVRLPTRAGFVTPVEGVDYRVNPREIFGVAGESGSGKTMSMLALLGLLPEGAQVGGHALYEGRDLLAMGRRELRDISGDGIAMVFQDPFTSLHPMLSIGRQMTDHMQRHLGIRRRVADARAAELLDLVRIPDARASLDAYPHQFSGGMRQRIAIAIALACSPNVLIADEPTTGLDVTVQAGILDLLDQLRLEADVAIILITHDLGVLSSLADRVAVFYAGRIVETGPREVVLKHPRHPYTAGLLAALPHPESDQERSLVPISGVPPTPQNMPAGCPFHPRCKHAAAVCEELDPALDPLGDDGRAVACHIYSSREA